MTAGIVLTMIEMSSPRADVVPRMLALVGIADLGGRYVFASNNGRAAGPEILPLLPELDGLQETVSGATERLRSLLFDLEPPNLGVGGLAEALRRLPAGSMAAFQSGPSRTADIEKKLILGMHGPGVTHVIIAG